VEAVFEEDRDVRFGEYGQKQSLHRSGALHPVLPAFEKHAAGNPADGLILAEVGMTEPRRGHPADVPAEDEHTSRLAHPAGLHGGGDSRRMAP
jgi:hypothetical protein